jgi:AraC-like DNA-binding protein
MEAEKDEHFFQDISILWISRFDYQPHWTLEPHLHEDFLQLIYVFQGSGTLVLKDNERVTFTAPAILFFPPNVKHGLTDLQSGLKSIDTKFVINDPVLLESCLSFIPPVSTLYGQDILNILEKIREEGEAKDIFYKSYSKMLFGILLVNLIRQNIKESPVDDSVKGFPFLDNNISPTSRKVIAFVENNYCKNLTSLDFEDALHYSYRQINNIFQNDTATSPIAFYRKYKILKAQELLKFSDMENKEISEKLGFQNVHQFSRAFSAVAGIPPGKWKINAKNEICEDVIFDPNFQNILRITSTSLN